MKTANTSEAFLSALWPLAVLANGEAQLIGVISLRLAASAEVLSRSGDDLGGFDAAVALAYKSTLLWRTAPAIAARLAGAAYLVAACSSGGKLEDARKLFESALLRLTEASRV